MLLRETENTQHPNGFATCSRQFQRFDHSLLTRVLFLSSSAADVPGSGASILNDSRQELQSHIISLKQQHAAQQQLLLQQYQESQLRLVHEQEKQMSEQVKVNVRTPIWCEGNNEPW